MFFVSKSPVTENQNELETHWNNTIAIANKERIHFVMPKGPYNLFVADKSGLS